MKEKRVINANDKNINDPRTSFEPQRKEVPGISEVIDVINGTIVPNIHTLYGNIDELIEANKRLQNMINEYVISLNSLNTVVSQSIGERVRDKNEMNVLLSQINVNITQCYTILNKLPEIVTAIIDENIERLIDEAIERKFEDMEIVDEKEEEKSSSNENDILAK